MSKQISGIDGAVRSCVEKDTTNTKYYVIENIKIEKEEKMEEEEYIHYYDDCPGTHSYIAGKDKMECKKTCDKFYRVESLKTCVTECNDDEFVKDADGKLGQCVADCGESKRFIR